MSYAPATLLQARTYLKSRTGLGDGALGIVGDSLHTYGYHLGADRLKAGDYSRQTARDRAGLTDAASALDIGSFGRLRELTAFLVREARAGHLGDVRELIGPGSDGRAYRHDHLSGWKPERQSKGNSHEWHLHVSFYRDSEHRSKVDMFRRYFEPSTEGITTMLCKKGDRGEHVRALQFLLQELGGDVGPVDGDYGDRTAAALAAVRGRGDGVEYGPRTYVDLQLTLAARFAGRDGRDGADGAPGEPGPPGPVPTRLRVVVEGELTGDVVAAEG